MCIEKNPGDLVDIGNFQFGFRQGRSTTDNYYSFQECYNRRTVGSKRNYIMYVFVDLIEFQGN